MIGRITYAVSIIWLLIFSACSSNDPYRAKLHTPAIYKAWNARYFYDPIERKMIPIYENRRAGKAWGRDQQGRMNFAEFYDGQGNSKEDLLVLHKIELDRERGRKWDELNRKRMQKITERLIGESQKSDQNATDATLEDDGMDFLPTPFIPAGIDMDADEEPSGGSDPSPFLPVMEESSDPAQNDPSPFLPLEP